MGLRQSRREVANETAGIYRALAEGYNVIGDRLIRYDLSKGIVEIKPLPHNKAERARFIAAQCPLYVPSPESESYLTPEQESCQENWRDMKRSEAEIKALNKLFTTSFVEFANYIPQDQSGKRVYSRQERRIAMEEQAENATRVVFDKSFAARKLYRFRELLGENKCAELVALYGACFESRHLLGLAQWDNFKRDKVTKEPILIDRPAGDYLWGWHYHWIDIMRDEIRQASRGNNPKRRGGGERNRDKVKTFTI